MCHPYQVPTRGHTIIGVCAQATLDGTAGTVFSFESDFDTNGLLYFLGTLGGDAEWHNPHSRGLVKCTCHPEWHHGRPASDIVGRVGTYCNKLH